MTEQTTTSTEKQNRATRYNKGKPELSYLLDFQHAFEAIANNPDGGASDVLEALVLFKNGDEYSLVAAVNSVLIDLELTLDPGITRPEVGRHSFTGVMRAYPKSFKELAEVCMFGAKKYARGDWLRGRPIMDTIDSAMRHYLDHLTGELYDDESGKHHLAHVLWNLMAILEYMAICPEMDDRPIPVVDSPVDLEHVINKCIKEGTVKNVTIGDHEVQPVEFAFNTSQFKAGDRVVCEKFGKGEVVDLLDEGQYPVVVMFDGKAVTERYRTDGAYSIMDQSELRIRHDSE